MSSGTLQPVRLGAQLPPYTPLPRSGGLAAGNLEAPVPPVPLVNYITRTGMNTWYKDTREANSKDCEYICQQEPGCLQSSFDTVLAACSLFGRITDKPSPEHPKPSPPPSAAVSKPPSAAESHSQQLHRHTNPIVCSNSPDPGAIVHGQPENSSEVIVVATGGNTESGAFPLWFSTDGGLNFVLKRYALPKAPKWWDKEALQSVERVQAFVNGSTSGSGSWESSVLGSKRARATEAEAHILWARVKLWAPEVCILKTTKHLARLRVRARA